MEEVLDRISRKLRVIIFMTAVTLVLMVVILVLVFRLDSGS